MSVHSIRGWPEHVHRARSQNPPTGRAGIDCRLLGRAPIENSHELMLTSPLLGAERSADLAQPVGTAFWQPGLVAAVAEPITEALGRERLAQFRLQKRLFAGGRPLDDLLEDGQKRLFRSEERRVGE